MAVLRSPHGCPWDRQQTHQSLRPYLLEEAYEVLDAIDRGDLDELRGELGDVLFQVVFHAEVAEGDRRFDIADVVEDVSAKLVRRHPHVFTPAGRPLPRRARRRRTPGAVLEQWERIKAREQEAVGARTGVLTGVPRALPALLRAHKIGARAATVGFDWPQADEVVDKIDEEVRELRAAIREGDGRTREEMGDLLFSLANLARKLNVEPEAALSQANDKFTRRFEALEARLAAEGRTVHDASPDQLDAAWRAIKVPAATPPSSNAVRSSSERRARGRRSR
jgi:ATP diphosphatase